MTDRRAIRQRALAAYLGLAIGDALGATTEFLRPAEVRQKYGLHQNIVGGGWLHLKPGAVTDDTMMSLFLGEALLEARGMDARAVAEKFVAWMRSKPVDIGGTVRRGLQRYLVSGALEAEYSEYSAGNGALMRNLPVIIAAAADPERMARWSLAQARITHNHPESDAGTLIMSELVRMAVMEGQAAPLQTAARRMLATHGKFDYRRHRGDADGYIVYTVRVALHYFFNTVDFESCLIGIVNQGGDADTNAAVGGMLAGAFYGLDALPARWLKKLDGAVKARIEGQADALIELADLG